MINAFDALYERMSSADEVNVRPINAGAWMIEALRIIGEHVTPTCRRTHRAWLHIPAFAAQAWERAALDALRIETPDEWQRAIKALKKLRSS